MSIRHEEFEVRPPHGDPIRGDVRWSEGTEPESAVVVAHGFKGFKDWGFFPWLAERLARAGHAAVTFNFSLNGIGPSGDRFTELEAFARNTFSRELEDLHQVLDRTARGDLLPAAPRRTGLLGHSRGGGAAVLVARERDDLDALVTWAAVATFDRWGHEVKRTWREEGRTWIRNERTGQDLPLDVVLLDDLEGNRDRLDVEGAAREVRAPWLIVHGEEDESVPLEEGERLARAAPRARFQAVAGAGHTFGATHPFAGPPPALEEAVGATVAHFRRNLGAAPAESPATSRDRGDGPSG